MSSPSHENPQKKKSKSPIRHIKNAPNTNARPTIAVFTFTALHRRIKTATTIEKNKILVSMMNLLLLVDLAIRLWLHSRCICLRNYIIPYINARGQVTLTWWRNNNISHLWHVLLNHQGNFIDKISYFFFVDDFYHRKICLCIPLEIRKFFLCFPELILKFLQTLKIICIFNHKLNIGIDVRYF